MGVGNIKDSAFGESLEVSSHWNHYRVPAGGNYHFISEGRIQNAESEKQSLHRDAEAGQPATPPPPVVRRCIPGKSQNPARTDIEKDQETGGGISRKPRRK